MLSRRVFLARAATAAAGGIAIATGLAACIDTSDPNDVTIDLSSAEFLEAKKTRSPFHHDSGSAHIESFFVVPYAAQGPGAKRYTDAGAAGSGLMVLVDRCTHDRCRVNFCSPSRWFECPCHGDKFNLAGEYKLGPAPRGMDRLKMEVRGNTLTVHPTTIIEGPPRGTNTTGQEKEGPYCV